MWLYELHVHCLRLDILLHPAYTFGLYDLANNITNTGNLLNLTSAANGFSNAADRNLRSNGTIGNNTARNVVRDRYGNPVTDSSGNAVTSVG